MNYGRNGNTTIIVLVVLTIALGGGWLLLRGNSDSDVNQETVQNTPTPENNAVNNAGDANGDSNAPNNEAGSYVNYSEQAFAGASDQERVYFFHANWCPTCRVADKDFTSNAGNIPANVVVFKTDYDAETELKKKFGVVNQHTFVLVDSSGEKIDSWNGGGVQQLVNAIN